MMTVRRGKYYLETSASLVLPVRLQTSFGKVLEVAQTKIKSPFPLCLMKSNPQIAASFSYAQGLHD